MTAEKWVVLVPIQYELLSLSQNADNKEAPFSGMHLDPMFVCIQAKFVCQHSMGNVNGMAEMLAVMYSFITENTFTTQSICAYLNMLAYCQMKEDTTDNPLNLYYNLCVFFHRGIMLLQGT
jgi:hypothetical protein